MNLFEICYRISVSGEIPSSNLCKNNRIIHKQPSSSYSVSGLCAKEKAKLIQVKEIGWAGLLKQRVRTMRYFFLGRYDLTKSNLKCHMNYSFIFYRNLFHS